MNNKQNNKQTTKVQVKTSVSTITSSEHRAKLLWGMLRNVDEEIEEVDKRFKEVTTPLFELNKKFKHLQIEII